MEAIVPSSLKEQQVTKENIVSYTNVAGYRQILKVNVLHAVH